MPSPSPKRTRVGHFMSARGASAPRTRVEQHHRSCWAVCGQSHVVHRVSRAETRDRSQRVGTSRFSSSVQCCTTTRLADTASADTSLVLLANRNRCRSALTSYLRVPVTAGYGASNCLVGLPALSGRCADCIRQRRDLGCHSARHRGRPVQVLRGVGHDGVTSHTNGVSTSRRDVELWLVESGGEP